jgi:peptide-methionine (R)-S-oxide reductase
MADEQGEQSEPGEAAWRERLTPTQYEVLRNKGTERAFTGELWDHKGDGVYQCAGCGEVLFDSTTKYDSGSGWPSFWAPVDAGKIALHHDHSFGMHRVEATCARCGGHLGHLFPDGPQPSGERFCVNSASLTFAERGEE